MKRHISMLTVLLLAIATGIATYAAVGANQDLEPRPLEAKHSSYDAVCLIEHPDQMGSKDSSMHIYEVAYMGYHYQLSTTRR